MISDADIKSNKPIHLFTVGGVDYKIPILPINKADDWLESASEVDDLHTAAQTGTTADRKAFRTALLDSIIEYGNGMIDREKLLADGVTWPQLMDAFLMLREVTDPFERATAKQMAQIQSLPLAVLQAGMAAVEKRNGEASAIPSSQG